ncbi:truncated hemoglobin Ctb [Niabella terrae]
MRTVKRDIETAADIRLLVDSFYEKVREEPLIGPIFNQVIEDRWPLHLEKMYRFWGTVLLGEQSYSGHPFKPHARLPVSRAHFDAWLGLWNQSIDRYFSGKKAEEARWRGNAMAEVFLARIEDYRQSGREPIV